MNALLGKLNPDTREALRQQFTAVEDEAWVKEIAIRSNWGEANRQYLYSLQERGQREMSALMAALGIHHVPSLEEAMELLEAAFTLYIPPDDPDARIERNGRGTLNVRVVRCPTFRKITAAGWHGVSACGSWHRRQGWYRAMHIQARDSVVGEQKWGDEACAATIQLVAEPQRT